MVLLHQRQLVRTLQPLGSMRAPRCPSRLTTLQVGLGGIYTIKREAKFKDCIEEGSTGSRCAASCALGALGCRQTSFSKDPLSLQDFYRKLGYELTGAVDTPDGEGWLKEEWRGKVTFPHMSKSLQRADKL